MPSPRAICGGPWNAVVASAHQHSAPPQRPPNATPPRHARRSIAATPWARSAAQREDLRHATHCATVAHDQPAREESSPSVQPVWTGGPLARWHPMRTAVLTISSSVSRRETEDESGPLLARLAEEAGCDVEA